jgi:hypothetical protein
MKYTLDLLPIRAFQGRKTPIGGHGLRLHGGGDSGYSSWEIDQNAYGLPAPAAPAADINSLYQELLGRAPDPTGIAANTGASADTIRQSIMASPEYASASSNPPPNGFFDMPGRGVETPAPYSITNGQLMQGNQAVYNVAPIQDDSGHISGYKNADTGEYVDLNKLNKSITGYDKDITNLYQNLLGRAPDVSEVIAYNDRLKSGEIDLNDVVQGFTTSKEYLDKKMPFLDPNADVNTKFGQGVAGFDAKGLVRGGSLEGLPTHYFDPKTGKLAAWFGAADGKDATDFYTWHTADELKVPGAEVRLAKESTRDVGQEHRWIGQSLLKLAPMVLAPMLAPAAAGIEAGMTAAEAAELMGSTAGASNAFSTGSELADSAIQNALMQGGKKALSGGDLKDILTSAGVGAVTSAAGDVAGNTIGDLVKQYYPDVANVDLSGAGDSGVVGDSGEGADFSTIGKSKDPINYETQDPINYETFTRPPIQLDNTQTAPVQPDFPTSVVQDYNIPTVDVTAGVPEQTLIDKIVTNPDVPVSNVLPNTDIMSLLSSGTTIAGIAEIINVLSGGLGGATSGGSGGLGGGGTGGGTGGGGTGGTTSGGTTSGGLASILDSIVNGGQTTAEDDATKKKKQQQQSAALAAIEAISAKTPPGAQIDYLYDIGGESIFAPMRQQTQKPKQDWAYEPNDRFAQGGMVAFDEGGDVTEETRALMHNPKLLQRGKDRMEREYPEDPSMIGEIAAGFHPIIGPALSVKDFKEAAGEDDYLGMGLAALGMIPIAGGAIKGYNRLVKPALRERAVEKELVANFGKIPKGQPIPEGYLGGPSAPLPRFPSAESQAGYYGQPKFQTDYGREFTHDLVHSSPSPNITSFNPALANAGEYSPRHTTLNPSNHRGGSMSNPLLAGVHPADDITTFLSNNMAYSSQYMPRDYIHPVGLKDGKFFKQNEFPQINGMPRAKVEYNPGSTMYPVSARLGKVFDPTAPGADKIAEEFLGTIKMPKGMSEKEFGSHLDSARYHLLSGDPKAVESAPFRSYLKDNGFDSFAFLKGNGENQVKNYGIFEPKNIRGKYAEFNPAAAHESDIMRANGGLIDLLRSK